MKNSETYKVAIKNLETGEVRVAVQRVGWHEASKFWWTEGNMGCDCNRELEFQRSKGVEPDFDSLVCGHSRYAALYAELPDGNKIELDGEA